MVIGVIGPSEDEIIHFIEKVENKKIETIAVLKFCSGKYKNVDVEKGILTEYHP